MCRSYNALAIKRNGRADTPSSRLTALRTNDHNIIPDFPATVAALDRVGHAALDRLLQGLGVAPAGSLMDKQALVKLHIGVVITTATAPES